MYSLFLNIAACYCDALGYKYIIFGANKEEALQGIKSGAGYMRKELGK